MQKSYPAEVGTMKTRVVEAIGQQTDCDSNDSADAFPKGYPAILTSKDLFDTITSGIPPEFLKSVPIAVGKPLPPFVVITEEQFRWLVKHIDDDPAYADHLKYGYFMRRLRSQWDYKLGYEEICTEMAEEEKRCPPFSGESLEKLGIALHPLTLANERPLPKFVASRRWLLLASVASYAKAMIPDIRNIKDYEYYRDERYLNLLGHAPTLVKYPELFRRILMDFCNASRPKLRDMDTMNPTVIQNSLSLFLPYWLPITKVFSQEPQIGNLVGSKNPGILFVIARQQVEYVSGGQEHNFALQRRIGLFFFDVPPDEAVGNKVGFEPDKAYMYRVRAIASPEFTRQPVYIRRELLNALSDICARIKRWDEAIAAQKRSVDTADGSRAMLARLYHRAADFLNLSAAHPEPEQDADMVLGAALMPEQVAEATPPPPTTTLSAEEHLVLRDKVLAEALADLARRDDIVPTVKFLQELKRDDDAVALLEKFLAETQEADEYRLRAIIELVKHYKAEKRMDDARRVASLYRPGDYKLSMPIIGMVTAIDNEAKMLEVMDK